MLSHLGSLVHAHRLATGLLVTVLLVVLLLVRRWRTTGPFRLSRVLPRRLSCRAAVAWRRRPFFGWARNWFGLTRFAFGTEEDSVAIVGPPRVGKTAGVLIPQALFWQGPLVSTSTKPDVLRASAGRRLELARQHGGSVYVYAPTATGPVEGLQPIRWSPLAGCREPRVAALRVEALITVAQVGRGMENADHWRSGAGRILRPYFLAAAHHPERPGDFALIRDWLSTYEFREPLAILATVAGEAGPHWARELQGVAATPERERGSFFSAAMTALKATADPAVLRSCSATDLDAVEFLSTRSTLYVVSPSEHQEAVAPLIAALIESLVAAAYELHREGRLPARLLLSLDELTNIAPLPSLESVISQGAGQGVLTSWAVQSQAQLRQRYGEHLADAIWSATRCKVVFGGLADAPSLEQLSRMVGDHRVPTRSVSFDPREGLRRTHRGYEWRPRVSPAELRGLPPRWALLLYHHHQPRVLWAPVAARRWRLRRAFLPWPPAAVLPIAQPDADAEEEVA
ncbi:MAG TPA: type IV secretory system conjugative DNA transfer family protein [Candidatus Dormibacteraeota bacterium]|nr:type IV secretory system conjugative DNA transfer family protein [Candidatus Dormibacteraeota bacterium]